MLGTRAEYQPQYELMQYQQKTLSTRVWPREQGKVAPGAAADVAAALYGMGCYEVSMGDTTGVGTPASVAAMFQARRHGPDPAQARPSLSRCPSRLAVRLRGCTPALARRREPAPACKGGAGGSGTYAPAAAAAASGVPRCRDAAAGVRGGGAGGGAGGAHA